MGRRGVIKLCPWPPVYNNSGSRLTPPHNEFPNRAFAQDFVAMYSDAAPLTLRNHALARLSPRFIRESRCRSRL
eukprot:1333930-Pyramimonas_sp.AAC.1